MRVNCGWYMLVEVLEEQGLWPRHLSTHDAMSRCFKFQKVSTLSLCRTTYNVTAVTAVTEIHTCHISRGSILLKDVRSAELQQKFNYSQVSGHHGCLVNCLLRKELLRLSFATFGGKLVSLGAIRSLWHLTIQERAIIQCHSDSYNIYKITSIVGCLLETIEYL